MSLPGRRALARTGKYELSASFFPRVISEIPNRAINFSVALLQEPVVLRLAFSLASKFSFSLPGVEEVSGLSCGFPLVSGLPRGGETWRAQGKREGARARGKSCQRDGAGGQAERLQLPLFLMGCAVGEHRPRATVGSVGYSSWRRAGMPQVGPSPPHPHLSLMPLQAVVYEKAHFQGHSCQVSRDVYDLKKQEGGQGPGMATVGSLRILGGW